MSCSFFSSSSNLFCSFILLCSCAANKEVKKNQKSTKDNSNIAKVSKSDPFYPLQESMIDLQNKFSPNSICFGCGPANKKGLNIKSIPSGNIGIGTETPSEKLDVVGNTNISGNVVIGKENTHSILDVKVHLKIDL